MDDTPNSYAYRCLPLNIANMHGWEVLSPCSFSVIWNGGEGLDSLRIDTDAPPHLRPVSHFGSGILTFYIRAVFRTEPKVNLYVTGPANCPKDGISPLTGIVETDWAPYSFTMNWKLTRPRKKVYFDEGEPFCMLFPVMRDMVENVTPEIRDIEADPDLARAYHAWAQSRAEFNTNLKVDGSDAQKDKWQKVYYRGKKPDGKDGTKDHRIKLHLREFSDLTASKKK